MITLSELFNKVLNWCVIYIAVTGAEECNTGVIIRAAEKQSTQKNTWLSHRVEKKNYMD